MRCLGSFQKKISYKEKTAMTDIYVIEGLDKMLLGSTCEKLRIVKHIKEVNIKEYPKSSFDPKILYPEVFKGLGMLKFRTKLD